MTDSTRAFRLEVEFDGTDFEGWQRQPPRPGEDAAPRTVQVELERAVQKVTGGVGHALACGRTDRGVHARCMVVRLRADTTMSAHDLGRALDAVLPDDIGLLRSADVGPDFHPVRDALWKWYRYTVLPARRQRPLHRRYAWRQALVPTMAGLEQAAEALLGTHDFASFGNTGSPRDTTVRTLWVARWSAEGELLHFDVVGDGFLYKMVRTLVGTQFQAARQPDPGAEIARVLAARDRSLAGPAVPGHGLTLMHVHMAGDPVPAWAPPGVPVRVESELRQSQAPDAAAAATAAKTADGAGPSTGETS